MISYFLKMAIIFLCIVWLYKHVCRYVEHFTDIKTNAKQSLYESLSADCKHEYCNVNNWPALDNQNAKIPNGYTLTQFSTNQGCCVIPNGLNNYIFDAKGDNNYKVNKSNNAIGVDSNIILQ
jgi:hypothetical protein